ncbi:MAG: hemerythrin family protein [Treponema sp.]|nr:hemerythrin family protein [Treponema sp.]
MQRVEKIEWDDAYLLGVPEIDTQHKSLIAIANELYDIAAGISGEYEKDMAHVLKELTAYTEYHFSEEEEFMERYGYPSCSMHKIAHEAFVSEVTHQVHKLADGNREDALLFYSFVVSWVLSHVARADKVWAHYVKPRISGQ